MSLIDQIIAFKERVKQRISDKTALKSIKKADVANSFNELADLLTIASPDGIISGLEVSVVDPNVIIQPGSWNIAQTEYKTTEETIIPYDQPDATQSRYDVLYADDTGAILLLSGELSLTPVEPVNPPGTVKVGTLLIAPDDITIIPPSINDYVDLHTDQTIDGIKAFLQSPQVPTAVGPNDAVPFKQIGQLFTINRIIDSIEPYNPNPVVENILVIKNPGDNSQFYKLTTGGSTLELHPTEQYNMGYGTDPAQVPLLIFDVNKFYAIEPDGVSIGDSSFLNSVEATAKIGQFTKAFALDYVSSYDNGNVNVTNKNLIVTATGSVPRAAITQLQIVDQTNSSVVYDGLASMGADLIRATSDLVASRNYKVLIASTDSALQIAIKAGNKSSIIFKTQNLLSGDTDNLFTAPLSVAIYE